MKTIFVSSTFKDMQQERDLLQSFVLPRINEKASQFGLNYSFCDLRWGINTEKMSEEEASKKVLDVCLDAIDASVPPMIGILGYRYGYSPGSDYILEAAARKQMILDDLEMSVTSLEMEFGAGKRHKGQVLIYLREIENDFPTLFASESEQARKKLDALKQRLASLSSTPLRTYRVKWDGKGFEGLHDFGQMVLEDCLNFLDREWKELTALSPLERLFRKQFALAYEKEGLYVDRPFFSKPVEEALLSESSNIVLLGETGRGKTTMLAHFAISLKEKGFPVLPFFGGSDNESNDAKDIALALIGHLEACLNQEEREIERSDDSEILLYLSELSKAYENLFQERVNYVFIDAYDQLLEDDFKEEFLLAIPSLKAFRFVVSSVEKIEIPAKTLSLPPLREEEKERILTSSLLPLFKELPLEALSIIKEKKESDNPLFLMLLVHRLLLFKGKDYLHLTSSEEINALLRTTLEQAPSSLDELSSYVLLLSCERPFLKKAARYIALSRYGLRMSDLMALLKEEWDTLDFIRFLFFLKEGFFYRDDGRIDFFHKSFRKGLLQSDKRKSSHEQNLLSYLRSLPESDPLRKEEFVYHLMKNNRVEEFLAEHQQSRLRHEIYQTVLEAYRFSLVDNGRFLFQTLDTSIPYPLLKEALTLLDVNLIHWYNASKKERAIKRRLLEKSYGVSLDLLKSRGDYESYIIYSRISIHFASDLSLDRSAKGIQRSLSLLESVYLTLGKSPYASKRLMRYFMATTLNNMALTYHHIYVDEKDKLYLEKEIEAYQMALPMMKEACRYSDKSDKTILLSVYTNLSSAYEENSGDLRKCLSLSKLAYKKAKELANDDMEGTFLPSLRDSAVQLAFAYMRLQTKGYLEKAEKLLLSSLDIAKKVFDDEGNYENITRICLGYSNLAYFYHCHKNDLDTAESYYKEAIELEESFLEDCDTYEFRDYLASSLGELSLILYQKGEKKEIKEAIELMKRALALRESNYEVNDTIIGIEDILTAYHNLARMHLRLKEKNEAKTAIAYLRLLLEKMKEVDAKRALAIDDPHFLEVYDELSEACLFINEPYYLEELLSFRRKEVHFARRIASKTKRKEDLYCLITALFALAVDLSSLESENQEALECAKSALRLLKKMMPLEKRERKTARSIVKFIVSHPLSTPKERSQAKNFLKRLAAN